MKTVYIMSAKYAPGHFSHMIAYYELFKAIGYIPILYINKSYKPFIKEYSNYKFKYIKDNEKSPDILFIYNLSPYDSKIRKSFQKVNPNLTTFFVYHEPWYGFKGWLTDLKSGSESIKESIKTIVRFIFVSRLIKSCKKVILPSNTALNNYKRFCLKVNNNYNVFPLIFTDECGGSIHIEEKQYFSFISTASNSKNFSQYIDYIKYKAKTDKTAKFQITTRTDVSSYIDEELENLIKSKRLLLTHGHALSNDEINRAYAISNCTWMLYARSTQSGALCKSFMFGSPVIASDIGSFNEVVNSKNGIILKDDYSLKDIDKAYNRILHNIINYSEESQKTFFNNFYWKNYIKSFEEILDLGDRNY